VPFDWRFLCTGLDVFHYSSFLLSEFSFIMGELGKSGFKKRRHTYEVKDVNGICIWMVYCFVVVINNDNLCLNVHS